MTKLSDAYLKMSDKQKLAFLEGKSESCEDLKVLDWINIEIKEVSARLEAQSPLFEFKKISEK